MFISCLRAQYITRSVTILSHAEIFLNFLACSVAGRYNELELPDKHKHEGKRVKTMPFRIIRNDITKVEADAIVNTANPEPVVGGGTDFSVHEAAGPELLEARKKIGPIPVGTSVETPAFRLPARYVLHTVSPVWIDGEYGEEDLLRKAYDSALALADRLGCRSVAFPLMAAGTYAFPHDIALATAIRAFTDFLMDHEMQIDLVLFNAKAFGLAESLFDDLKSYIDDNYVEERQKTEYRIDDDHISNRSERAYEDALLYRRRWQRKGTEQAENLLPKQHRPSTYFKPEETAAGSFPLADAAPIAPTVGSSFDDIFRHRDKTFSEYLLDLLRERDGKDSEVYKRAEVSKQLFSKILSNRDYRPTKDTAVQLAIGLQLDIAQTQKLLEKAGYVLTRSSKTDLVVQYYIERKVYSIPFINAALDDCGLPMLKTGAVRD